jgi:hypothetical protein
MTGVALAPHRAIAQTVISTSTGVQSWTTSDFTVTSTGSISGGSTAITAAPVGGNLSNSGVINGSAFGVSNGGAIGTANNNGTVIGGYADISNSTGATISQLTNSATGSLTGGYIGVNNDGNLGTLTNDGAISTTSGIGVLNTGSITALNNLANGNIAGGGTGIFNNGGSIGSLSNSGKIAGSYTGVFNNGGSIGTLSNSGSITGAAGQGLYNSGSISQLTNAAGASISGGNFGIGNGGGSITALANSGAISGYTGIDNAGTIGALSNDGTVSGTGAAGISNSPAATVSQLTNTANGIITGSNTGVLNNNGSIGTLTNSGKITGAVYGINNAAGSTLGNLINSGMISGTTAILLNGTGTALINSGVIASTAGANGTAIALGAANTLTFTTGSTLVGNIQGGGTASTIALQGNGALTSNIFNLSAGALNIAAGANWAGQGNWTIGTVTNNGTFEPGATGSTIGSPLSLTGNYVQASTGKLVVMVTPTASSVFSISGNATLNGNVTYQLAPGTYTPKSYTYLTAGSVTGKFTSETYTNGSVTLGGLTESTSYLTDPGVALVLTASTPTPQPVVVAPSDDGIFSDTSQAVAQVAQQNTGQLLDKAIQGGASNEVCQAEAPLAPAGSGGGSAGAEAQLASALGSAFCRAGGWIEATGALMNVGSGGSVPGYNANTAGFLAGIDKQLTDDGARLGIAVGYGDTFLRDGTGGGSSTGLVNVSLYGAQPIGRVTLSGVISYGSANSTISRASGVAGVQGKGSADVYSGGAQASTSLDLGQIVLVPAAGIMVAGVDGNNFGETAPVGLSAYALGVTGASYTSIRPYASLQVSDSFTTASDLLISTNARAGYEYEAGDRGVSTTLLAADGTSFTSSQINLDPSDALLSAGVSVGKNNWSLYANYVAHVSGNWTAQTGEFGLHVKF